MTVYTRNNENPANATPVWITGQPSDSPAAGVALVATGFSGYDTVSVSQTNAPLGATGAVGDYINGCFIQPTNTTVGSVIVKDGSTVVWTYPGGTVGADLRPISVPLFGKSVNGAWNVTTPSSATFFANGQFTS